MFVYLFTVHVFQTVTYSLEEGSVGNLFFSLQPNGDILVNRNLTTDPERERPIYYVSKCYMLLYFYIKKNKITYAVLIFNWLVTRKNFITISLFQLGQNYV